MGNELLSIIEVIIALALVLSLAYISLKFGNKWMKKQYRILNIIEKIPVANNSYLGIIQVGEKYFLMSLTNRENSILKELDESMVLELLEEGKMNTNFSLNLNHLFGKRK